MPRSGASTIDDAREQLRVWPLKAANADRDWQGVHIDEFSDIVLEEHFAPPHDHANTAVCTGTSPLVEAALAPSRTNVACGRSLVCRRVGLHVDEEPARRPPTA